MRWRHALGAVAALAFVSPAAADLDLRRADVSHLPNGLTVIMLEDHSLPLVSVQMLYKSGSAAEVTGKTGLAHFLEHLAFRGSENFPNARATELIYDSGGEWHGYTAMDQTTYFATMPKDGLDLLLKIEADRMARVVIDPTSIDAEKGAVITELDSYENDPASVLQDAVTRTAIQAHPYGSPMAGYVSDVEALTIDDAEAYYASHYAPGNAVLTIVGDFVTTDAKALLARDFANVSARPVAVPHFSAEPYQNGERRILHGGAVDRQFFVLAYHAPAASSPDFPAFLLLQELLAGGSGLNLHQSNWTPSATTKGSLLFGATGDIASWLPPTRDSFLFTINGSIAGKASRPAFETGLERRIASLRVNAADLDNAKARVIRSIAEDVQTTEDAAHQLAFFEGVGALDQLLEMPKLIAAVSPADVERVAKTYLVPEQRTVGWFVPGKATAATNGAGNPQPAADRPGQPASAVTSGQPQIRRLSGGLSAIVHFNPLSDQVTAELLLSGPTNGGVHPDDLAGLDALVRSGRPADLSALLRELAMAQRSVAPELPSDDPATRLQQLITAQTAARESVTPTPLAVIVSGNVSPGPALNAIEHWFDHVATGRITSTPARPRTLVREKIDKPLAQGGFGYIVDGPPPGTREELAWRMLLYVLTHDYSGRLGNSAIRDKGLVYHIYSLVRTDGRRTWATISTGVDPDRADAMEAELRAQIARLASEPPTQGEVDAARNHLLGRDLTQAQSNEELAAKFARQFVETGGLRSHEQLESQIRSITPADLAAAAASFGKGTILRVDVANPKH